MQHEGPRAGSHGSQDQLAHLRQYPLLEALTKRRSRRFGAGMNLDGGPLAFKSALPPQPLSSQEEAALAFAACGITGHALLELPFSPGSLPESGGGTIVTHLDARTVASGDALYPVIVFVINDSGVWMLKRPQDYRRSEIPDLIEAANGGRLLDLYERSRVRVAETRPAIPRDTSNMPPFNKWSVNVEGSTSFVPVHELSAFYINLMLGAFSEENAFFILDERHRFAPAGIGKFARSRGGHLEDDPAKNRVGTVAFVESWLCEFTAIEQGGMLQNLALMTQALGLGGFPHFAAHPYIWLRALGFRIENLPFSRTIGAGPVLRGLLRALKKEQIVPTAVGLEHEGEVLIKPFSPPYYRTMEEAVLAFVDYKFSESSGTLRSAKEPAAWLDGANVQRNIPRYSDRTIAATIAYCEYIYHRYGRFPAISGPFRTVLAHQAHHLDPGFYDKFYRPGALSDTQVMHQALWHPDLPQD